MRKFRVVLTSRVITKKEAEAYGNALNAEFITIPCRTEDEIIAAAGDADAVVTLMQPYTRRVIEKLTRCRMIYNAGTGFDSIDVAAASERGICVAYPGDYCMEEVAEHAIALLLACARKITRLDRAVRQGKWVGFEKRELRNKVLPPVFRISGSTMGVVGFGRIGRATAARGKALGMSVVACDPYVTPDAFERNGVRWASLEELLRVSDYVVLEAASSAQTRHMIGIERFRTMKPSAYIINVARGSMIDQNALFKALSEGLIAGAGLDVVEEEPDGIGADHPLLTLDNVIVTGHSAYYSEESSAKYRRRIFEAVESVVRGKRPEWLINPEVKSRLAA
ncbi:MAG: C-terminal binding protein [Thermodesulfobacteriota bacterium]